MKSIHESDDSNYSRNGERMHPEKKSSHPENDRG